VFFGSHFLWGHIHGLYITRLPVIFIGIFTYFYLQNREYKNINLLYGMFALMLYFIERHNLMYTSVVPLILYAISAADINICGKLGRAIKKAGTVSFELFLAHCLMDYFIFDNYLLNITFFIIMTIIVTLFLHYVNKQVVRFSHIYLKI